MAVQTGQVVVSNGTDFFEIDAGDLPDARAEGFYLPHERDLAVVTNGVETLEIPLADVPAAEADGFRCISQRSAQPDGSEADTNAGPLDIAAKGASAEVESVPPTVPVVIEETPDEESLHREELRQRMREANAIERVGLWFQLQLPPRRERERLMKTYGLALFLHLVVLFALSFYVMSNPEILDGGAIISSLTGASDDVVEAAELPQEVVVEPNESETSESSDAADEIADALDPSSSIADALSNATGGLDGLAEAIGKGLDESTGAGEKANAAFFGSNTVASRFVFVIDNSNSMTKGRFETALNELGKTILALTPEQSYYVVFYSDTAYPLFHPANVSRMIPATDKNKGLTLRWLNQVPLCLRTDAAPAIKLAYALQPDVIFVLGDGAFTDSRQVQAVMDERSELQRKIRIHALGMEVNAKAAENFVFLAKTTGGTYRDVGVHPRGRLLAQQNPRPRNNKRNGVWGLKLPAN